MEILLEDPSGKLAFAAFLQDEFAIENLNFLIEAHKFSTITKFQELKARVVFDFCREWPFRQPFMEQNPELCGLIGSASFRKEKFQP